MRPTWHYLVRPVAIFLFVSIFACAGMLRELAAILTVMGLCSVLRSAGGKSRSL